VHACVSQGLHRSRWRALALLTCCLLGACALSARPAEQTLSADADAAELEAGTRAAIEAARAEPADAALQVQASAWLFQAADMRLQRGSLAWLDANPAASQGEVLAAEDHIDAAGREAILSLCTTGLQFADRAAELTPKDPAARLHQALHLSLIAWANGPARSLMAGYGTKLVAAIDAALALDRDFDHGAVLRLQGRFRGKAPWPYGDMAAALAALRRAAELASLPVNHLFLGDALAAHGELDAARAQWQAVIPAEADVSTRWSADLLRELARRRLAARP
jgi:hypothetical protein